MQLKIAPQVNPRYWTVILLASMCGTNLGDFFPRVLHIGSGAELITLAILFAAIMLVDTLSPRGIEALYWMTILVVRAAATSIVQGY